MTRRGSLAMETSSTPGSVRTYLSRKPYPTAPLISVRGPRRVARLTSSVRSDRVSGGYGAKTWSSMAVATMRTSSVKLIPNRLMNVKNLRRSRTLTAIFR